MGVGVGVGKANKKKRKERKGTKKREELECVGGVKGRKITRNWSVHTYGVWLCGVVLINMAVWRRVDQYDIDRSILLK